MRRTVRASSKKIIPRKKRSGFTLIEMTFAFLIAASWIGYVLMIVADGVRLKRMGALQTEATHLAKIKMAQIDSATLLQTDTTSGDIPGYKGWRFTTIVKDENIDLLKLSGKEGKKPEDLLGGANSSMNQMIAKRTGNNQGSATGGLITVYHIFVTIEYPTGALDSQGNKIKEQYTVETFKARNN